VLAFGAPAHAGTEAKLTLVAQDAYTRVGAALHFQIRVDGANADDSLSVIAHEPLDTFNDFEATSGDELGGTRDTVDIPIALLPADPDGIRTVTLDLERPGGDRLQSQLGARGPGVYPLEVELRDHETDETRARFVTYLVEVAAAGETGAVTQPLGVAWVWPIVTAPTLGSDSTPDPGIVKQLRDNGRIGEEVQVLSQAGDVPVTVVPGPDTVQTWLALAKEDPTLSDGAKALGALALSAQVLSAPYVPVNLPSLLRAGMTSAVDAQLVEGGAALRALYEEALDGRTMLVDPVDSATLGRLRTGNVDRVIVDSGSLVDRETELTPARPFRLDAPAFVPDHSVAALAADRRFAELLSGDAEPALRAQRFLAALSVVAFEDPEQARAVTVLNPRGFDVAPNVLEAVFAGLRSNPILRPMKVGDVFDSVESEKTDDGSTLVRELTPSNPPAPPVAAQEYTNRALRLASFEEFAPDAPGTSWAKRALLSSVSSDWTGSAASEGPARLDAVDEVISGFLSRIHVPAASTITLTSRSGDIPFTVRNSTGEAVKVQITVQSPKLSFPNGPQQVVSLPRRSTTIRFPVESRTSGSFPVRLVVRSADGNLLIAQARFRVEATAVSTVGLALIIGAVSFLALWWIVHIRRERHRRRIRPRHAVPVT
jgi:hypothetical protein